MSKPTISVVVCTFNRASLLNDCLESLGNQSANKLEYEVIIVDNNSTDDTEKVGEEFLIKYPIFRYIKEGKQGLSHARNCGFREAYGEYVAYIDDDAKADTMWVENIIDFTLKRPGIVAFGGPYEAFSQTDIPKWYSKSYGTLSLGVEERPITENEWISGTNMIFKKNLLKIMGGFHIGIGMSGDIMSYGEDTNLLVKIKKRGDLIFYVPDIVVEHLTAEYKMSLKWMLKSSYKSGFSAYEALDLQKRPTKQLVFTCYILLMGVTRFIFSRQLNIKARILDCFSHFFWHLGLAMRLLKS